MGEKDRGRNPVADAPFPANGTGAGSWAQSYAKAAAMVANMSLVEKVSITAGVAALKGCSGFVPAVPSVKFPGLCLSDAGQGLRNAELVSSWPSGIHAAAR